MLKKWVALLSVTAIMLAACNSPVYNQTEGNIADTKIKAKEARIKSDTDAMAKPPLVVKQGSYVDMTPVSIEKQPTWLRNHIVIRGDQLPFSYYSRVVANGAETNVLTKYQVGLDPSTQISVNYSGTIKGALDLIAAKSGYVYTIKGNSIYWEAFLTRTYDIAFMPGGTDYLMGKSGGGGSSTSTSAAGTSGPVSNYVSSDSSDSEYSSLKGTLSVWKDLDTTIKQLMSPDGKAVVSESTTSVTVRDRPTNVHLIGQYIANLNRNISKQVLVKVQILDISLSNDFIFGINWSDVAKAFHNSPFMLNANYGQPVSITATLSGAQVPTIGTSGQYASNGVIPSWTILFNTLNQQGKTSVVTEPRVVCLNNQVSVIRIVSSQGYAASVQNTSLGSNSGSSASTLGTVTSQITPGTVITGLTLYLLPKIMKDRVYLQVNADLSTNNGFTSFGPAGSTNPNQATIELPNITEKHFNQRSMIRSGDTLILSGFRQVANQANAMQFLTSQSAGGRGSTQANVETVILITPIILNGSV